MTEKMSIRVPAARFNENNAPDGFIAKKRGEQFCYECAFHTGASHNFNDCMRLSGRRCAPSGRDDRLWVVFVARGYMGGEE